MLPVALTKTTVLLRQVTKGLWKKWGDKRVKDTPITEVMLLNVTNDHNSVTQVISMLCCIVRASMVCELRLL